MRFIYSSQLLVSRETLGLSRILIFLMSERVFPYRYLVFYSCFIISQILIVSRETKKEGTCICLPGK